MKVELYFHELDVTELKITIEGNCPRDIDELMEMIRQRILNDPDRKWEEE